jgi:hypothetical protein
MLNLWGECERSNIFKHRPSVSIRCLFFSLYPRQIASSFLTQSLCCQLNERTPVSMPWTFVCPLQLKEREKEQKNLNTLFFTICFFQRMDETTTKKNGEGNHRNSLLQGVKDNEFSNWKWLNEASRENQGHFLIKIISHSMSEHMSFSRYLH